MGTLKLTEVKPVNEPKAHLKLSVEYSSFSLLFFRGFFNTLFGAKGTNKKDEVHRFSRRSFKPIFGLLKREKRFWGKRLVLTMLLVERVSLSNSEPGPASKEPSKSKGKPFTQRF